MPRRRIPKPATSTCENPDHDGVHGEHADERRTFAQAKRGTRRRYCPYLLDGTIAGKDERSACQRWVADHLVRVLAYPEAPEHATTLGHVRSEYLTPTGDYASHSAAVKAADRFGKSAGVTVGVERVRTGPEVPEAEWAAVATGSTRDASPDDESSDGFGIATEAAGELTAVDPFTESLLRLPYPLFLAVTGTRPRLHTIQMVRRLDWELADSLMRIHFPSQYDRAQPERRAEWRRMVEVRNAITRLHNLDVVRSTERPQRYTRAQMSRARGPVA